MIGLTGYLILFVAIAVFFIFIHLVMGRFLRPVRPDAEKLTIYECGEPTVGSAWVQFDLRYYVVALLFVIFDVEVAFFFPWAVVFGKANQLSNSTISAEQRAEVVQSLTPDYPQVREDRNKLTDRIRSSDEKEAQAAAASTMEAGNTLAWIGFLDILVFFGVLLIGFIYLWARGDLDWVRSTLAERVPLEVVEPGREQMLVGSK